MKNKVFILLMAAGIILSCSDFLQERSNSSLTTPVTLEDNQALLDRNFMRTQTCVSAEISSNDIYVSDADFNNLPSEPEKRLYTWQPDRVAVTEGNDWSNCFARINVFNNVLHNLDAYQISGAEGVKGQALVFRASAYLEAAQIWCLAYDRNTATFKQGLPLRLDPDMNIPSVRSTLQQTYDQILSDLHTAELLLPPVQISAVRPSKVTALAYLARTYLYMGDYEKALLYGRQALAIHPTLLDYNTLNAGSSYPVTALNVEILLPLSMTYSPLLTANQAKISEVLYNSYDSNDLRKTVFFRKNAAGEILFKGNYSGGSLRSSALATDEVYLTVAESYAQTNQIQEAMNTLNTLLVKRWKSGTFIPFVSQTKEEALQIIRTERWKELVLRGMRWADVKRYNREGAQITLMKTVNGQNFFLPPNDLRYAIAIPEDIIEMTGMSQNER